MATVSLKAPATVIRRYVLTATVILLPTMGRITALLQQIIILPRRMLRALPRARSVAAVLSDRPVQWAAVL